MVSPVPRSSSIHDLMEQHMKITARRHAGNISLLFDETISYILCGLLVISVVISVLN